MAKLVPLANVEPDLIEQLLDRAFGPERLARTAYRMREGTHWLEALSFAALDEDDFLVGTIQVWPIALSDPQGRPHPMLMIGPVAVLPELPSVQHRWLKIFARCARVWKAARTSPFPMLR